MLFAAVLGSGIAMIDGTVVNIALPTLGKAMHADFGALQWTVNGYTLTLASFILLGGSFGDRFGRRKIFVVGVTWFGVASLICGVAQNINELIAARMLQGIGGALLTPGSLAIISASFRQADRGRAIGAWSGLGGIASAVGPLLGGLLVPISWRLIFLINLPLCAIVVSVCMHHVPESRDLEMDPRIDYSGAVTGAVGLAGVTYALVDAGRHGFSPTVAASAAVGLAGLVAFIVAERRSTHPMVPLDIFASRQFTAANLVTFVVYGALGGLFFLLVVDLQVVGGFKPLAAGFSLIPMTLLMLLLSSRVGALAQKTGPRFWMATGPIVAAVGALLLLRTGINTNYWTDVLPGVVVFGLGLSATVAPLTTTVLAAASSRHAGVASGVNNAVARAASLLAVAIIPLVAGISGDDYQNAPKFNHGFHTAAIACAILLALGGIVAGVSISNDKDEQPS
ncbi:MFS transporter [Acidothermaceae bacterium B102]|nr:MFS transporter [Acidothermaceae bacterium B102]